MKIHRYLLMALLLIPGFSSADEAAFAPQLSIHNTPLERYSTGSVYYAGLFHLYDAALYSSAKPPSLFTKEEMEPLCLVIAYRMGIDREQLISAAEETLLRQGVDIAPLDNQLQELHRHFSDVDEGDRYSLCYHPQSGTELRFNGILQAQVPGERFARSYLGIWLAEQPISEPLRDALLRTPELL